MRRQVRVVASRRRTTVLLASAGASAGILALIALFLVFPMLWTGDRGGFIDWRRTSPEGAPALALFDRGPCLRCPSYQVVVYADGYVEYLGIEHVKVVGEAAGRISDSELSRLLASFREVDFEQLADRYGGCALDTPTVTVELRQRQTVNRVVHHQGGCDGEQEVDCRLTLFENEIDSLLGTERWTGVRPDEQKVPKTCLPN